MQLNGRSEGLIPDSGKFLDAWKKGISVAGEHFFRCEDIHSIEKATDKDQLRPNWKAIKEGLRELSPGEAVFLIAMYSYFNAYKGQELFKMSGLDCTPCHVFAHIDLERRVIIAQLGVHYCGW
ncbi:hypothetical protein MMIC_P0007 [Mariprofundus micogutta]|uniref:Uncharacterized protein n=1 Tax=Mariprofundus micogutta TaxID=1921010 RepID=A0A1L8CJN9_9PROT|nr:hypothetical protein [Mariprofundus micogutta]GAV19079.1 hypothetical protein MMIC_P0007 [Mariprofundus micogutta]